MREIEGEIEIAGEPDAVTAAFTDVQALKKWWGVREGLVDARQGGVWSCTWDVPVDGFGFVILAGRIRSLRPGEHLHIEDLLYFNRERPVLGPMRILLDIEPHENLSRIKVRQDGYGKDSDWDWYYGLAEDNWPKALGKLKDFLEG
ncbi:MAG: SRPBCC domain-containing protein [Acidobacteriota bacterium]